MPHKMLVIASETPNTTPAPLACCPPPLTPPSWLSATHLLPISHRVVLPSTTTSCAAPMSAYHRCSASGSYVHFSWRGGQGQHHQPHSRDSGWGREGGAGFPMLSTIAY